MRQVNEPQRGQLVQQAQLALDNHQPRRYRVTVNPEAVLEDEGWFHIVVQTENDRRDRDFYDAVAEAEAELNEAEGNQHQFLLVPAIAD